MNNNNPVYSLTIIIGMMITAATDSLPVGQLHTVGITLGLAMMITSLLVLFVNNHETIMESDAPGARIYQRLMVTVSTSRHQTEASLS